MGETRIEYILQKLESEGQVRVSKLSAELGCSEVTIRNDIQKLENKGLLKRIHGGAVKEDSSISLSMIPGNITKNPEAKKRIAHQAFLYINNEDTIILDDSSVNYYLAKEIENHPEKSLIVITNSLIVSVILSACSHVTLFMLGGQIGGKLPAAMGELAVSMLSNFKASKAFISAHGVNFDVGITSIGTPQLQVKKAILDVADQIYLLVDSSKFGGGYVMVAAPLARIERIITDNGISPENRQLAEEKEVPLDIV
ncbi:MAG: DeoR/GlpR family DNA-binding transcription regulator [Lachnospiraceae bacterium]|nr:DeoR/GlpR family DNA-binding transcription regulator [Lachnospiraceae bacterium]